ncbi:PorP/SprF family type IX secretion system membrane protein [Galbibacter sp. PAP.153]|uniref:PorP/SprF family type IX secretion system membrane protein n=1 Tax=Galbibacter sp. PAP.153 TaxID=3104623 RepID=UPI0030099439
MTKNYLLTIGMLLASYVLFSQVENKSTIVDWRQHNLTKYDKFLVNPTYSYVRNDTKAVSFWSRIQWTGVENSPQTYLISYSGKVGEHSGAGLGLYQQNLGLLTDSGLILNYAYGVQFTDNVQLTVGMNSTLFRRGLNKNAINTPEPDPAILDNQDDFLLLVMPGVNLSVSNFDIGVYAENLFDYNFNDSNTLTDFSDKIFSGQLAYTKSFDQSVGLLEDAKWRTLVYGKTLPNDDFQYGFNSLIDLPYTGWFQAGYNSTFGIMGGIGVKIGDGISIGINYETGTSQTNNAFGSTYEAIATIELGPRKMRKNPAPEGGKAVTSKNVNEEDYISSEEIKRKRAEDANNMVNDKLPETAIVAETQVETKDATDKYAVYGGESKGKTDGEDGETKEIANNNTTKEEVAGKQTDANAQQDGVKVEDASNNYALYGANEENKSVQVPKNNAAEKAAVTTSAVAVANNTGNQKNGNEENKNIPPETTETVKDYKVDDEDYAKDAQAQFNETLNNTGEKTATMKTDDAEKQTLTEAEQIEAQYQEFLRQSDSIASTLDSKNIDSTAVTTEVFGTDTSYKTIASAPGIEKGFYLVVNVFSQEHYFNDFVDDLRSKGFEPKFFINPENNYYYVYLYKADRYITIKSLQRNNVNNTYFADKWVLWVK